MEGITPEQCHEEMKRFYKKIRNELGDKALLSGSITIIVKGKNLPLMAFLDVPGQLPSSISNMHLKDIVKKQLEKFPRDKVHPIICTQVKCADALGDSREALIDMLNNPDIMAQSSIVITHMDKVSTHPIILPIA